MSQQARRKGIEIYKQLMEIERMFVDIGRLKVAVIGDVMLDTYLWGKVDRISPEAPVPVVALQRKEKRIGGAGNVALNVKQLGAHAAVITILGSDDDGVQVKEMLQEQGIDPRYIITSRKRITTNKTRVISRNQQMLRLDAEITDDLDENDEDKLLNIIEKYLNQESPDVVILEDYNKGLFTQKIITETIRLCKKAGVIITVDPKRKNFFEYKGVHIFKPNLSEATTALNLLSAPVTIESLAEMHKKLHKQLDHQISLITLSEKGIFYQEKGNKYLIPAHKREIADVSGAGDTVIAVASLVYAATRNIEMAVRISNMAGGLVCEEVGTIPVSKEKLMLEAKQLLGTSRQEFNEATKA